MRKATFVELKSGSEWFIAICVSRSKSLLELYIGGSRHESGEIRRTAANVHLLDMAYRNRLSKNLEMRVFLKLNRDLV